MMYQDRVYGQIEIDEPVILELINSPTIQRLKHIDQGGYYEVHFPGTKNDRFEHSMGVYLLLKLYKAPLEEQIAGLIHDASHSAFSHCIDYVLSKGTEKYQTHQDEVFSDYIKTTELPEILTKHGFDVEYIIDDSNFLLKESELPDLCADRLDYSLRQLIIFGVIDKEEVEDLISLLKIVDSKWVFDNFAIAKKYVEHFRYLNDVHYSGPQTAHMFRTVGDYLRYGLQQGYLNEKDLYTTDNEVLVKLKKHHQSDAELEKLFRRMNNDVRWENNPEDYNTRVFCKSRVVDPLCFHQGEIRRVSDVDQGWKEVVDKLMQPKEYFLKFYD